MAIPFSIGDAADLVDVSIQKIWKKESDLDKVSFYDKYAYVESGVDDYYLKDSSLTGLGNAARIVENAVITAESPVQGFDKTYTQVEFGKVLSVTKRMWKFGIKKRDLTNIVKSLDSACRRKREIMMAERLDNSFSTSYTHSDDSGNYTITCSGGDAVAFVSASHTREDGGTAWGNRITDGTTVNMDFDYDAIKAAHRTASLIRDGKGNLMNINLDTVVVKKGSPNHFRALEILRAKGIPGSADNDAMAIPPYKIITLPWLAQEAYWYMFDSSMVGPEYGLQYKESQPISLEGPNIVFKTGEIQYKSTMMFDLGHNDSRIWVGSKGTNAA